MSIILFHYRDCIDNPQLQIRTGYAFSAVELVANEHRKKVRDLGEKLLREALANFAKRIHETAKTGNEEGVEKVTIEATVYMFLFFTEFTSTSREMLRNSVFELALDPKSNAAVVHLGVSGNPLDPPLMCFSAHLDDFMSLQRNAVAQTNQVLWSRLGVIDGLLALYDQLLGTMAECRKVHPVLSNFALSVQTDLAPSVSLAMGGRIDAALAIARRGVEMVGFCRVMIEDPEAIQTWLCSGDDYKSGVKFRKRFDLKSLFPKSDGFWDRMYKEYSQLSAMHHPNPSSFSRTDWEPMGDGKLKLSIRQLQYSKEEVDANAKEVWRVVELYYVCLVGLVTALSGIIDTYELSQEIVLFDQRLSDARSNVAAEL